MHLTELTLDYFRSYEHLALSLAPGLTLVIGDNATGKSNLLEAIYLLAATRSPRAGSDGELIAWNAPHPPLARVAGDAIRADGPLSVEIAVVARTDPQGRVLPGRSGAPLTTKRLRLNGIAKRASEVVGQIGAVLFTTHDMDMIAGPPSARRRYLDLMIAQTDRGYAQAFTRYTRALAQRNALLKRIAARAAGPAELAHWDGLVAEGGATIVAARADAARYLAPAAQAHHQRVAAGPAGEAGHTNEAGEGGALTLDYRPALGDAELPNEPNASALEDRLRTALAAARERETGAGVTLVGPHRDDLVIWLNGRPAAAYASRAQQRSIALALRLAEAGLLRERSGEAPLLLLDDVFSELDPHRRTATARALEPADQLILTTADEGSLPPELPSPAARYRLEGGRLRLIAAP